MDTADKARTHEFGRRFASGLSWSAAAQSASQAVTFVASVLLARMLAPADFGLVAMALVYTTFVWILGQTGFNSAIVYLDDVTDTDLCTMYWANLGFNAALFAGAVALAPVVGRFFRSGAVVPIIVVASLGLIVSAVGGVQRTLLEKRLDFQRLALNQFYSALAYAVAAVTMALAGMGVWSLVVGRVLEQAVDSALAMRTAHWRPKASFSRASLSRLLGYGSRVWAGNMLFYGQENIDNLVVGRMLGAAPLGLYALAFRLANVPRWFFVGLVGRVMFPTFSSGRDDLELLRRTYLRICSYAVALGVGLGAGMALVAREFVGVVYGQKWLASVTTLRVLALAGGIYCVGQVSGPVLLAMGKPGLQTRLLLGSSSVLLAGALLGVRWGIAGVATAVLAAVSVAFALGQFYVMRTLDLTWGRLWEAVAPSLKAIGAMAGLVYAWQLAARTVIRMGDAVDLAGAVVLGAVGLLGTLAVLRAPPYLDLMGVIGRRGRSPRRHESEISAAEGEG